MFPSFSGNYVGDRALADVKKSRYFDLLFSLVFKPPNLLDLILAQLRTRGGRPMNHSAMRQFIHHIVRNSIPSKVVETIVLAIPIIVTCPHPVWPWRNKCGKNKPVDRRIDAPFVPPQTDIWVSVFPSAGIKNSLWFTRFVPRFFPLPMNPKRPNPPHIANLVIGIAVNSFPHFIHNDCFASFLNVPYL